MPRPTTNRTETSTVHWVQETLFRPNTVELTVKIGAVLDADHLQWTLESRHPKDGSLLALTSRHHASIGALQAELELLRAEIWDLLGPF